MKIYNKYFVCLLAILLAGCKKRKKVASTASTSMEVENSAEEAEVEFTQKSIDESAQEESKDDSSINLSEYSVFYAYDRDTISQNDLENLNKLALWLSKNDVNIVIYGNCDSRGSVSYNVGLGSRRANAVKKTLVAKGISANRIIAVSTGQEILVPGTSEEAYAKNRVARIEIKGEGSVVTNSKSSVVTKSENASKVAAVEVEDEQDDEDDDN